MDILGWSWSFTDWSFLISVIVLVLYFYGTKNYSFFSKKNVPHIKPSWCPFLGTMGPVLLQRLSFPDFIILIYNEFKGHPFGGMMNFTQPTVLLRDPELIKAVTVKDFDHFTDHQMIVEEDTDPMWGKGIFNLQGQRWRDMRSTLSPAFTSSKMKTMFVLVDECGTQLVDFLEKCSQNYTPDKVCKIEKAGDFLEVEMKDLFTRYANDVIATAAFGVSVDSLMKPSNEFYLMGKDVSNFGTLRSLKWMGHMMSPSLMKLLNITLMPSKVTTFFRSLIYDTMTTREREGIVRPDLIQLLMQARKSALQDDSSPQSKNTYFEDDDLAAQAFLFFLAGFDTTSTLLCFASHQLAVHPDVQTRLQEEIDTTIRQCGGNITYEALHNMKYLDMVISETLRLYPPAAAVDRKCVKTYTLPSEPPYEMKAGEAVWIAIYALHRDPDYFPEPERFDPERFSDENKHDIKPFTYMPFGVGPRICIGSRFALMESKIALVHLLSRFTLKVVSRTPIPIQITKKGFNMTVDGGFWLGLELRKTSQHVK